MILKMTLVLLIGFNSVSALPYAFMPNLPVGEYRVIFDKVYPCESMKNHSIQFNYYFSKKSSIITQLKGNLTLLVPLDDTLTLDVNFASWGSTGGWKQNALVFVTKSACKNLKNVLGNAWFSTMKGFNIPTTICPLPVGTYISSGIDTKEFEDHNFPKVFFYGKYKASFRVKNEENKVLGCMGFELNLIRPWENPV